MKKLVVLLILLCITLPSHAFFWKKKDKALETELQGKGYAGSLPEIEKKNPTVPKATEHVFEPQQGFVNPADLKPVPRVNPAFIIINAII